MPFWLSAEDISLSYKKGIIIYCMAMRGIPEYIALARTILHSTRQAFCVDITNSFDLIPWLWFQLCLKWRCIQCWFDKIFDTLQAVCHGCDYYVTIESAQTICAPLLQNAQYATQVRKFCVHTPNRREKREICSDIALFYNTVEYGKSGKISRKKGNMVWYGPQSH